MPTRTANLSRTGGGQDDKFESTGTHTLQVAKALHERADHPIGERALQLTLVKFMATPP